MPACFAAIAIFLGLLLHAIGLASIGLACSAFTSSQLVAAIGAGKHIFVEKPLSLEVEQGRELGFGRRGVQARLAVLVGRGLRG